ncbi:MAG TPA: DUF4878 domain-containing protein [Bacteroidetes bacterium]|nr:DUF4878 domain-containing protein [Bacteroidota bacterium]
MTRSLKLSVIALIGVMTLWACGASLGPKETGEKFLKAMKTGDFDTAKDHATKEAQGSLEMMAGMADGKEGGDAADIVIGALEENGDKATLSYTDAGKDLTLALVKEGGEWKADWKKGGPGDDSSPLKGLEDGLDKALDGALDAVGDGE